MNEKIKQTLDRLFEQHRIIFWYDGQKELRVVFDQVQLDGVEKVELANNEFGLKYHILCEAPRQKFLIYHAGAQPADQDNWMLDVMLSHGQFRTDRVSITLSQLDWGPEYAAVVEQHSAFFRESKWVESLKRRFDKQDSLDEVRLKMLQVCTHSSSSQLDNILEALLGDLADNIDDKEVLLARCELDGFLWKQVQRHYDYTSPTPNIKDFAIELFKRVYAMGVTAEPNLHPKMGIFFQRWRNNSTQSTSFKTLATRFEELLNITHDLEHYDYHALTEVYCYQAIDLKIMEGLVRAVREQTISTQDCEDIIAHRQNSVWYTEWKDLYLAIKLGAQFINTLESTNLFISSLEDGIQKYSKSWYLIDQLYRQFTYHARHSHQRTIIENLQTRIDNLYTNNYLLPLNEGWQHFVDEATSWHVRDVTEQTMFFSEYITPYSMRPNKKIFVIISDALRYEVAVEMAKQIRQENRYDAEVEAMLSVLPSYTQLGMAALLPHDTLSITAEKGASVVFVDGQSSQGLENRNMILSKRTGRRGVALQSEDFSKMDIHEARALSRDHDIIYLYHNRIDSVGDKRDSEERVVEAVEDSFKDLIQLIKKLANANANNILVTTDHGFLYQDHDLEESDYLSVAPSGHNIIDSDRRFVIGRQLHQHPSLKYFTSAQLNLTGDLEFQFPRSINRLRKKGSGSRYVHGGATLQEVVIPVIKINKKRINDVRRVEVSIVSRMNQLITSGQITVKLYQKEPVTEKVQARELQIGIYSANGTLISDSYTLAFDMTSTNDREREKTVRLILSKDATEFNNQSVYVRLMERVSGTSHDFVYGSLQYTLRRSFTSDFDL